MQSYGDSYAMKYVLLKGLLRVNSLCDETKLKNLLKNKSFVVKEKDPKMNDLLNKITKNITVFTVSDIHSIIKVNVPSRQTSSQVRVTQVQTVAHNDNSSRNSKLSKMTRSPNASKRSSQFTYQKQTHAAAGQSHYVVNHQSREHNYVHTESRVTGKVAVASHDE